MRPKKKYIREDALSKLRNFCAYRERCHSEIQQKLYEWGFDIETAGEIILTLMEEGFLNEERFARAYARGKFKYNNWGRIKIGKGLSERGINAKLCEMAFSEIEDKEYNNTLQKLLEKKKRELKEKDLYLLKQKLYRYALGKGYEPELIWEKINRLVK